MKFRTISAAAAVILIGVVLCGLLIPVTSSRRGVSAKLVLCKYELTRLIAATEQYQAKYGSYPPGGRREFIRSLLGDNSDKIAFVELNRSRFNPAGEFLDPWGTPYEIQIIPGTNLAVRSAGKNKKFGDKDDQVSDTRRRTP
jgi:hypothetical protein